MAIAGTRRLARARIGMVARIFLAVDRAHMRRIVVKIGAPDSKLLPVRIDPFPERFAGGLALGPRLALDAHDVGCESVAIASARTAAVVGSVVGCLQAACDGLPIVVAKGAGDAGREARLLRGVKHVKQPPPEALIHASEDIVDHGHAGPLGGLAILPGKFFVDMSGNGPRDSDQLASFPDRHFSVLFLLDGVFLGRALDRKSTRLNSSHVRISY